MSSRPRPPLGLGRLLVAIGVTLLVTGCGAGSRAARSPAATEGLFIVGYHPWWDERGFDQHPWALLHQLFFFEIEMNGEGGFLDLHGWPDAWEGLLSRAEERGVQVVPTITMHDREAFEALFSSPERRARAVTALVDVLRATPQVVGLQLDFEVFEPVREEAREGYSAFAEALRAEMTTLDSRLGLSVFTLAFDDADVYDEAALAAVADFIVVQGYDLHHRLDARAGPVAATRGWGRLNWETILARYRSLGIEPEKMVMAVPLYGYQWPTAGPEGGSETRGAGVAIPLRADPTVLPELPRARAQADRHGLLRDEASGAPWYRFRDAEGAWTQGWFDDAESLRDKYRFVRREGLGGIAIFPLSYGDPVLWRDLEDFLRGRDF